jgi:hypothetical protein
LGQWRVLKKFPSSKYKRSLKYLFYRSHRTTGEVICQLCIRLDSSEVKAHQALKFEWSRKPLYNVIAKIPGEKFPDQWIIRGNHHDAWVMERVIHFLAPVLNWKKHVVSENF